MRHNFKEKEKKLYIRSSIDTHITKGLELAIYCKHCRLGVCASWRKDKKIENRHVFKVYFFLSGLVYLLQCLLIHDAGSSWVMKGTRNNRTIQAEASTITNTTYISLCVHTWNRIYRLKNCSMKSISFSLKKNSVLASFSCGWWK